MPRTVTVRVWTLLAVVLLATGGTLYAVGTQESAPTRPEAESISVAPASEEPASVVNSSALPRKQQAVFLLAVDPGGFGSFYTTDSELKAALEGLPGAVRYEGTVYEINDETGGGTDHVYLPLKKWVGAGLAGIGVILLLVLELPGRLFRSANDSP